MMVTKASDGEKKGDYEECMSRSSHGELAVVGRSADEASVKFQKEASVKF